MVKEEFLTKVKVNPNPVVVDVWAPWCAPCRMIAPALDRLAAAHAGTVDLWKINADEEPDLTRALGVLGIPTILVFRNGEEVARQVGAAPESRLAALFAVALGAAPSAAKGPAPLDRVLRLGSGALVAGLGVYLPGGWPLVLAGAAIAFTAVYDRCPIWNAIAPRVRDLLRGRKNESHESNEASR